MTLVELGTPFSGGPLFFFGLYPPVVLPSPSAAGPVGIPAAAFSKASGESEWRGTSVRGRTCPGALVGADFSSSLVVPFSRLGRFFH